MSYHHEYGSCPKSFKIKSTRCSSVERSVCLTLLNYRGGFNYYIVVIHDLVLNTYKNKKQID